LKFVFRKHRFPHSAIDPLPSGLLFPAFAPSPLQGRKRVSQHSSSDVAAASGAARAERAIPAPRRPRWRGPKAKEETMRVLSQTELNRLSRTELMVLLRKIAGELPNYPADSIELRNAHTTLLNIRRALARPAPGPRPW